MELTAELVVSLLPWFMPADINTLPYHANRANQSQ